MKLHALDDAIRADQDEQQLESTSPSIAAQEWAVQPEEIFWRVF